MSAAIEGNADYFITTDDKLLRKLSSNREIRVINPVDIVGEIMEIAVGAYPNCCSQLEY